MLRQTIAALTIAAIIMLGILLTTTTPSTAGPLGTLGFFVFMYVATLGVLTFLFYGLSRVVVKTPLVKRRNFLTEGMPFKSAYYYASVIALVPVMLVAMQSVSQIGVYQLLLIGFFVIIAWMYVTNRAA